MLDVIVSTPPAPPTSAPDWIARVLATASLVLTAVVFVVGQRGRAWRGRRDDLPPVTTPLEELRLVLDAVRQDATNAYQLWSVPNSVAIDSLEEAKENHPDRRLRALLTTFLQQVSADRGSVAVNIDPGQDPPPLKGKQSIALTQALATLDRLDLRIRKIKRKGASG